MNNAKRRGESSGRFREIYSILYSNLKATNEAVLHQSFSLWKAPLRTKVYNSLEGKTIKHYYFFLILHLIKFIRISFSSLRPLFKQPFHRIFVSKFAEMRRAKKPSRQLNSEAIRGAALCYMSPVIAGQCSIISAKCVWNVKERDLQRSWNSICKKRDICDKTRA